MQMLKNVDHVVVKHVDHTDVETCRLCRLWSISFIQMVGHADQVERERNAGYFYVDPVDEPVVSLWFLVC